MDGSTEDPNDGPLVAGSPPGENEDVIEEEHVPWIIRYITLLSRIWGIITITCLWVFMVLTFNHLDDFNPYAPWYLLGITLLMTFIELIWLINKCAVCRIGLKSTTDGESASFTYREADISSRNDCCCTCWRVLVWLDNWRKALLYIAFGIPMFIHDLITVYTSVAGFLILVTAALYFIKSFKYSKCVSRRPRKHANIQTTSQHEPSQRFPPHLGPKGYQSMHDSPPKYSEMNGSTPSPTYTPSPEPTGTPPPQKDVPDTQSSPPKVGKKSTPPVVKPKRPSIDTGSDSESKPKKDTKVPDTPSPEPKDSPKRKRNSEEFKLFGLLRREEKRKEPVVAMVSSQRSEDEDLEQYPDDKNPFGDDDKSEFEWDPDNRG